MSSLNKVMIIGRLGADPELKKTKSGLSVLNMRVATSEFSSEGEQRKELTEWHQVTVWGKNADNSAKYLKKGSLAYVEGRLQTRTWEKDGQKHYTTEIIANSVQFLTPKEARNDQATAKSANDPNYNGNNDFDPFADIPF